MVEVTGEKFENESFKVQTVGIHAVSNSICRMLGMGSGHAN